MKLVTRFLAGALAVVGLLAPAAQAATYTWNGSASDLWSNSANWTPAGVPANSDSLVFPAGTPSADITNDTPITFLAAIDFGRSHTIHSASSLAIENLSGSGTITFPNSAFMGAGPHLFTGTIQLGGFSSFESEIPGATIDFTGIFGSGGGTVDNLQISSGFFQPNTSVLSGDRLVTGDFALGAGGTLQILAMDFDPNGYAYVKASGAITLAGSLIFLGPTFPTFGTTVVVIRNVGSGAVTGTFAGLPEGAILVSGGGTYQVSYVGGAGNDVTLTVVAAPKVWTGAVNALWSEAGNWAGGIAPASGDVLQFDAGASNASMTNDLVGLAPGTMYFNGAGYSIGGNGLKLADTLNATDNVVVNVPVELTASSVAFHATFNGGIALDHWSLSLSQVSINGNVTGDSSSELHLSSSSFITGAHPGLGATVHASDSYLVDVSMPSARLAGDGPVVASGTVAFASMMSTFEPRTYSGTTGIFSTGNLNFSGSTILQININGPTAGTGYSQIRAAGVVQLNNGALQLALDPAYVPTQGQVITLIDNQGPDPVVDGFQGMPQGAVLTLGPTYTFELSYVGGDGNDVTLTSLNGIPPTATMLSSVPNPSPLGVSVTFTATVTSTGTPTGSVMFYEGATLLATSPLVGGVATFSTAALPAGAHSIVAQYPGDGTVGASASAPYGHTVAAYVTTTTVVSSLNPSEQGTPVTFTATVTSGGTPTGTVTFKDFPVTLATVALVGGTASHTTSALGSNIHTITATYNGDASNDPSTGTLAGGHLVVDTTPPDTAFLSTPPPFTNSTTASFTFTGSDTGGSGVDHYDCKLDGGAFLPCNSSGHSISGLAAGTHTLLARAGDNYNNADPTPASFTWTVDTTPPTVALNGPFAVNFANQGAFAITGTCADDLAVTVTIDFGDGSPNATVPCSAGVFTSGTRNLSGNVDGIYTITATATDQATNTATASATLEKHAALPVVTIDGPPPILPLVLTSYGVSGDCSENGIVVTVQVGSLSTSANCGAPVPGRYDATPVNATGLAQGDVTITASQTSVYGNTGTATEIATKDTVGPLLTIDALDSINNANKGSYGFSGTCETGNKPVSYELTKTPASVSGAVPNCLTGTFTVTGLDLAGFTDGSVSFEVTQADTYGTLTTTNGSVVKDTVNPSVTIDPPVTITSANQAAFTVSGTCSEAGVTITLSVSGLPGSVTTTCGAGSFQRIVDLLAVAQGPVDFDVTLTDSAGNSATAHATANKDSVAAPPVIAAPAASAAVMPNPTISGNGAEIGATITVSEGVTTVCSTTADGLGAWICGSTLGSGSHTITAIQSDLLNNTSAPSAPVTFLVDTEGPVTSITASPPASTNASTATFQFTANDGAGSGVASFECELDGSGFAACTSPATFTALDLGPHTFQVRAIDLFGNVEASPALFTWFIDPPSTPASADVAITQAANLNPASSGKDVIITLTATNNGPALANGVTITNPVPSGADYVWASPACGNDGGTVTCNLASLASGASASFKLVLRPPSAGALSNVASIAAVESDPHSANNTSSLPISVIASAVGNPVLRYRLYSDVTKEHHFTTDLNEYNVLGTYVGTWVQEGTVGKVLDNPGFFNGVEAVPYYRLYDTSTRWHHWTTDANEFYTLGFVYGGWNMEGVDGYLLPTSTAGTTQLYRLNYPYLGSLHHWTIDQNEYNTLIGSFGWVGEGGAGFVVQ